MSGVRGGGEKDAIHQPLAVYDVDGMPFVKCSCDIGYRPQSSVWLREHWQGTEDAGIAALRAVVARQSRTFTADDRCICEPCAGRGNDGHGLTHCAECCFGTGVEVDLDCPIHGQPADLDDARTNRIPEREADYLSPDEQAFLTAERAAEAQCPACGWTGARG